MNDMKKVLLKGIETYGEREQSAIAMEECGELIHAINKYHRKNSNENRKNLVEEIADVLTTIETLKIMYNLGEDEIKEWQKAKVFRFKQRLESEGENG